MYVCFHGRHIACYIYIFSAKNKKPYEAMMSATSTNVSYRQTVWLWVTLATVQIATCVATLALLADNAFRMGWARAFATMSSALGVLDGLSFLILRFLERQTLLSDFLSGVVCILISVGIVGLICNTDGAADTIEEAACLLVVGWGALCARFASSYVEREAMNQCTYRLQIE
jgi:hypothetical protein